MSEPSVTLSDYLMALICFAFAWYFCRAKLKKNLLGRLWALFFVSAALASFIGGTVHGFYSDKTTLMHRILWPSTLLMVGITASICWILGGFFLTGRQHILKWISFATLLFMIYAVIVFFMTQNFLLAILYYLPAMIFLLVVVILRFLKTKMSFFLWIIIGILVSFFAAWIQQSKIGIHPYYFNHNTLYHLVQVLGFLLVFIGAKGLVTRKAF